MTLAEKILMVQTLVQNDTDATDALITVYLNLSESAIFNRLYPFGIPSGATVPTEYEVLQCRLAARYFDRRGAEGEIVHNENGINRTYQSVDDEDLLKNVIQIAKI